MVKLLLFLSNDHLYAQLMAGKKIILQREFAVSPDGQASFAGFLREAKHPAYLLVDLIEEDFRQDTVPHLSGRSRSALLQRKLDQFYPGTPFRQATLLQRQQTGRRDDEMLFSALTNPALITPWLEIMRAQQIPLAGIYSIPRTSAALIKGHPSDCLLLITWEKQAGLRQSYFSEHRLRMSRLTPMGSGLTFREAVINELARTFQYLKNLGLLPPGQILDVRLIGSHTDLAGLQLELPPRADMRCAFADIAEIAKPLGIDCAGSDATRIFLHHLAAKPPKAHYASAAHTRHFAIGRLRRALNAASAILLLGSLWWAAANIRQGNADVDEAASQQIQARHIQREAQEILPAAQGSPIAAADMKAAVSVMRELEHAAPLPADVMRPLSRVLDRYAQIELGELAWRIDVAEPAAANTLADAPAQVPSQVPTHVIDLKGNLTGFAGDYRAALHYLENFRHDLGALGYRAAILDKPLDVSPAGSITDQRDARSNPLPFSIKLSRMPPP